MFFVFSSIAMFQKRGHIQEEFEQVKRQEKYN